MKPAVPTRVFAAAAALLGLAAYGPLLFGGLAESFGWRSVEGLFFDPDQPPALMVVAVAGWLSWRRRSALVSLPAGSHALAWPLLLAGLFCAAWARWAGATDWLLFSLAANALAFVAFARGTPGARRLTVPVVALLFAIPIPDPLENELLWALQRIATQGALALHTIVGLGTEASDAMLQRGESGFLVIEECSGLRGVLTLGLVSLVVRDLFAHAGRRSWWVVALSPLLALAINAVRVAWIASADASPDAEGHIGQGVSTLLAGTAALFFLGRVLAWGAEEPRPPAPSTATWPWRAACAGLALVVLVTVLLPERPQAERPTVLVHDRFADRDGWDGTDVAADRMFIGRVAIGALAHKRFVRRMRSGPQIVDLFVGLGHLERPRESPYSSKLLLPGRDWSLREMSRDRDWRLFRDVEVAVATRGEQRALVRSWRLSDPGFWRGTLRSFLAVPFARPTAPPRAVVRLVTPLAVDTPRGRTQASQVLDAFLATFGGELEALEEEEA